MGDGTARLFHCVLRAGPRPVCAIELSPIRLARNRLEERLTDRFAVRSLRFERQSDPVLPDSG